MNKRMNKKPKCPECGRVVYFRIDGSRRCQYCGFDSQIKVVK